MRKPGATENILNQFWKNLDVFSEMDVYGHIDYIVRYGPNKNLYYSYERYQDILDENTSYSGP